MLIYLFFVEKANINNMNQNQWIIFLIGTVLVCWYLYNNHIDYNEYIDNEHMGNAPGVTVTKISGDNFTQSSFNGATVITITNPNPSISGGKSAPVVFSVAGNGKTAVNYMLVGGGGASSSGCSVRGYGGGSGGEVITGKFIPGKSEDTLLAIIGLGGMGSDKTKLNGNPSMLVGYVAGTQISKLAKGGNGATDRIKGTGAPVANASNFNGGAKGGDANTTGVNQKGYLLKINGDGKPALMYTVDNAVKTESTPITLAVDPKRPGKFDGYFGSGGVGGVTYTGKDPKGNDINTNTTPASYAAGSGGKANVTNSALNILATSGLDNTGCGAGGERGTSSNESPDQNNCVQNNASGGSGVLIMWF